MKQITLADVDITVTAEAEDISIKGNAIASGDDAYDTKIENEIAEELESNEWAWCCVKVTATYKGLEATDYLGCCSYKDKQDFINNSGYYEDMVGVCLADLNTQAAEIVDALEED